MEYLAGIDVGSTTVKLVILNEKKEMVFQKYQRHFADIVGTTIAILKEAQNQLGEIPPFLIAITGSGGMGLAEALDIPFIQEVIACTKTVETLIPQTDVAIELGGEDAKITFFDGTLEQRMNGSCAGGTGAFIDQMAILLKTDADGVNEYAKNYQQIYPIASRCGVFAKTDIQPLMNEGAKKEDLAASIFQAVVNQTIAGLASGRKIKGNVAFLGGPLYFMSELRNRFIETLHLTEEQVIFPENPQLFVALGAAFSSEETKKALLLPDLIHLMEKNAHLNLGKSLPMPALFKDEAELTSFQKRHRKASVSLGNLADYHGVIFVGIDAGSTTTKVVAINPEGEILYQFYGNNEGQPLETTMKVLQDLYEKMPKDVYIGKSCVTGYGEGLIKNALKVDLGEVETMAHYKAADFFQPGVDFILDIGGQDMKAMKVKDGVLSSIQLNEACSSGCGSFIETFAKSMNVSIEEFAKAALLAKEPVDLGSRCTVFMNSKVKQVQKEGASVGEISAGLSYSVIKNALFKVIKARRPEDLGEKIVCQGGTFYNEAVLRAFELISKREVIRPSIAGLMGAFGCGLIALEAYEIGEKTSLLSFDELTGFQSEKEFTHCGLCENNCFLTVTVFSDGRKFVTGNRCERGAQIKIKREKRRENLVEYKYRKVFHYRSLKKEDAKYGRIGIPRVLNMYENYPLWHTFFTQLGFQVVLSPKSSKELYEKGIETIPSDTACYPAKLVHGHIQTLIEEGIPLIFYPGVIFERIENQQAENHYNCPIVQSYPDVIKNNMDDIIQRKVDFRNPYLNLANEESVLKVLLKTFSDYPFSKEEMKVALDAGYAALAEFKENIRQKGEKLLAKIIEKNERGIVLAGRPYHLDPEINHGISQIMTQEGFHVLTEDSISHLGDLPKLRVVNQWVYHARLYAAAALVAKTPQLELVQLNSFGCGIDAITTDQVAEIMAKQGKIYTVLKIDEGSNLGAIRIRLRSLKAAIKEREKKHFAPQIITEEPEKLIFTKEMRKKHTLLLPMLSPIHQEGLLDEALKASGYHVVCLPAMDKKAVDVGLRYVNNDACYPAIISIGQILEALNSGKYNLNEVSVLMTQTGGGCRATNYIPLLRKALTDAGFSQVPVVSISMGNQGVETNPGFKFTLPMLKRIAIAVLYGDLFERVLYRMRPYEKESGAANALYGKWLKKASQNVKNGSFLLFNQQMKKIVKEFDQLPILEIKKPKVGVVGEILVKYSKTANNDIVGLLEKEGAEAVVPDLIGFMNYSLYNQRFKYENLGMTKKAKSLASFAIEVIEVLEKPMNKALEQSIHFEGITSIYEIAKDAASILSIGNHTGEGWFLTGEMMELLNHGVNNIVCLQPFGCLPNHVVGKGVLKSLRHRYPKANIAPIDYDPGVSVVNQLNRIRLMLATGKKELAKES